MQTRLSHGDDSWHSYLGKFMQANRCSDSILRQFGNIDSHGCLRLYISFDNRSNKLLDSKFKVDTLFEQVFGVSYSVTEIKEFPHHLACISRIAGERLRATRLFAQGMDTHLGDFCKVKPLAFEGLTYWLGHLTHATAVRREVVESLQIRWEASDYAAKFSHSGLDPLYADYVKRYAAQPGASRVWVSHIRSSDQSTSSIRTMFAKTGFLRSVLMAQVIHLGNGDHLMLVVLPVALSLQEMVSFWAEKFNRTAARATMDGFTKIDPHTWSNFYMGLFAFSGAKKDESLPSLLVRDSDRFFQGFMAVVKQACSVEGGADKSYYQVVNWADTNRSTMFSSVFSDGYLSLRVWCLAVFNSLLDLDMIYSDMCMGSMKRLTLMGDLKPLVNERRKNSTRVFCNITGRPPLQIPVLRRYYGAAAVLAGPSQVVSSCVQSPVVVVAATGPAVNHQRELQEAILHQLQQQRKTMAKKNQQVQSARVEKQLWLSAWAPSSSSSESTGGSRITLGMGAREAAVDAAEALVELGSGSSAPSASETEAAALATKGLSVAELVAQTGGNNGLEPEPSCGAASVSVSALVEQPVASGSGSVSMSNLVEQGDQDMMAVSPAKDTVEMMEELSVNEPVSPSVAMESEAGAGAAPAADKEDEEAGASRDTYPSPSCSAILDFFDFIRDHCHSPGDKDKCLAKLKSLDQITEAGMEYCLGGLERRINRLEEKEQEGVNPPASAEVSSVKRGSFARRWAESGILNTEMLAMMSEAIPSGGVQFLSAAPVDPGTESDGSGSWLAGGEVVAEDDKKGDSGGGEVLMTGMAGDGQGAQLVDEKEEGEVSDDEEQDSVQPASVNPGPVMKAVGGGDESGMQSDGESVDNGMKAAVGDIPEAFWMDEWTFSDGDANNGIMQFSKLVTNPRTPDEPEDDISFVMEIAQFENVGERIRAICYAKSGVPPPPAGAAPLTKEKEFYKTQQVAGLILNGALNLLNDRLHTLLDGNSKKRKRGGERDLEEIVEITGYMGKLAKKAKKMESLMGQMTIHFKNRFFDRRAPPAAGGGAQ